MVIYQRDSPKLDHAFITEISEKNFKKSNTFAPSDLNVYCNLQAYYWLFWLTAKLRQEGITEFFIEKIQPSWLETRRQKLLYQISIGVMSGLLIGCIYGLTTGWVGATIGGVSYGLILGWNRAIYPISRLKFSLEYARYQLVGAVFEGLWWGVIYGLIDALICGLIWGVEEGWWGMIQSVVWGLVEGLIWGVSVPEFKDDVISHQGIRDSATNAGIFTVIGGAVWLFIYTFLLLVVNEPLEPLSLLLDGICSGLFFGIYVGGLACLQYFMLRLILWWNGYIPWNYAKFLDKLTSQGLLKYRGGCYQLNHN